MKSFLSIALIFSLFIGSSIAIDAKCAIRAETCAPNKSCCVGVCLPMKNVCSKRFSEICTDNHGICRPDSEYISIGIGKQSKKEIFKWILTDF